MWVEERRGENCSSHKPKYLSWFSPMHWSRIFSCLVDDDSFGLTSFSAQVLFRNNFKLQNPKNCTKNSHTFFTQSLVTYILANLFYIYLSWTIWELIFKNLLQLLLGTSVYISEGPDILLYNYNAIVKFGRLKNIKLLSNMQFKFLRLKNQC